MRLAIFAYSRTGLETAGRIREVLCAPGDECRCFASARCAEGDFAPIDGPCADFTGPVFHWADALVFVGAAGIAVRSIAPHVHDKRSDPAVLTVDELGKFVIPLLSGHIGGANALAKRLAGALNAVPVITTATDIHGKFAADEWAARQGLFIDGIRAAKAVSAALLEGGAVFFASDLPVSGALPEGLCAGETGELGICISCEEKRPFRETLLLVPPILRLGLGCRRGTTSEQLKTAVSEFFRRYRIHPAAVKCVASVDLKRDEPGLAAFCRERGWPLSFYSAEELSALPGDFTVSGFVRSVTGVDCVCERAALMGADRLVVRKTVINGVTAALATEYREVHFE